jgi:peptide methionine sulfoxide reductase msrA/msrB
MTHKAKSEKQKSLTDFESYVIEKKGTEPPFTGLYTHHQTPGVYACKRCAQPLYQSDDKFPSHCGWPSFDAHIPGSVKELPDADGRRTEIICSHCQAHLGHVFRGENFTPKNTRHCVNSVSLSFSPKENSLSHSVVLASGCFWGTQHFLSRIPGVIETTVGYCGGHVENPTYKQVCTGTTGHVEAVRVIFDPLRVKLDEILKIYFETHDFTQFDGQGPDKGPQYLSVMFYRNHEEKQLMEQLITELKKMGYNVATTLKEQAPFWPAEDYHQNYYESKGDTPYCHSYKQIFPRD